MSSSSMSTGTTYFIEKYKLAYEEVAKPESKACECEVKAIEELMAAPYKTFRATKTARKELKGLRDVTEKDTDMVEEFLNMRREELKKKEEEKQNAANGPHKCEVRQPSPKIILNVKNSPLRRPKSSRSGSEPASPAFTSTSTDGTNDCKGTQTSPKPRVILSFSNSPLRRKLSPGDESSSFASGSKANDANSGQVRPPSPRIKLNITNSPLRRTKSPGETAASPATQTSTANNREVKPPSPRIKLNVPNSTFCRSNAPKTGQSRQSPVRIRLRVSKLSTQAWEQVPEPIPETPAPTQAPPQQRQEQNTRKRNNEGLFDLEFTAKPEHSEFCKPAPVHEVSKPFVADHHKYVNNEPTSISEGTIIHEDMPTKQMVTRGMAKKGATKRGEREGGRKTVFQPPNKDDPLRFGTSGFIKDQEIADDLDAIKARKKEQNNFRVLRKKLKAMARHYESQESPNHKIYIEMKTKQAKRKADTEEDPQDGRQAKKVFGQAKAVYEDELKLLHQEPAKGTLEAIVRLQEECKTREESITLLIFTLEQKIDAFNRARSMLGGREVTAKAIAKAQAELDQAKKNLETAEQAHHAWIFANNPKVAGIEEQPNDFMILHEPKQIGTFETERKAAKAYKEAERCAHLAKQTVEAKEKLVAMARELETIDKEIGPDPNGPRLSAIPAHIRTLMVPAKAKTGRPLTDFAIRTNGDFPNRYINTTPRKPSNLRFELGACLAEEEAAEAAQAAERKAEIEEKQRKELQAEQSRIRRENAQKNVDKYLETGTMPELPNEDAWIDFRQALTLWFQSDEGKRRSGGEEYAEGMAREQTAADSQAHFGGVAMQRVPTDEGYSSMMSASMDGEEDKMDGVELAAMSNCSAMRRR